ncbi:MAG: copper chaperone PCu(A)C [Pseudomonadota bacterium]
MKILSVVFGVFFLTGGAFASGIMANEAWVRTAPPGAPLAGYFELRNHGDASSVLTGATAEGFTNTMLHRTVDQNGVMKMEHVTRVEVSPGETFSFQPGGYHIMLMKPEVDAKAGDSIPITLQFESGHAISVEFIVREAGATMSSEHSEMDHGGSHEYHSSHGDHSSHDSSHGHGGADGKIEVSGPDAPSLKVSTMNHGDGQWMLVLATTNFEFREDMADAEHQNGMGHAHLHIDGKKVARLYESHSMLPELEAGTHKITVGLFSNDHRPIWVNGSPVEETVTLEIE